MMKFKNGICAISKVLNVAKWHCGKVAPQNMPPWALPTKRNLRGSKITASRVVYYVSFKGCD